MIRMRSAKISGRVNLRVGHWVEVRRAKEILETLDENGCLDGLPFMPEMLKFCGQRYKVLKRINKIWDLSRNTGLRKMTTTIILENIRCDGYSHGGCQAGCHLLWREAWLRRVSKRSNVGAKRTYATEDAADGYPNEAKRDEGRLYRFASHLQHESPAQEFYRCQATQLFDASSYLSWWDPRQYVIDLWSGNVSLSEFVRGALIGLFNTVQSWRGGATYPHLEPGNRDTTPSQELNLRPGEVVQIRSWNEIQATLDRRLKNRGLWFDKEMIRYCGGRFRVLRRVERTIDEKTGRLLKLRNPCIILDGVTATGEHHRFMPQNEYIFWREIWLKRDSRE
jgi:hypothetical protein